MEKGTVLYKAMEKYRRKFLIINLVVLAFFIAFTVWRMPYLKTWWFGSTKLDVQRFLNDTKTFTIDEVTELDRHETKEPESYYYKDVSYWQGDKYLFDISVDNIQKTDIVYKSTISVSEKNTIEYESARIYLADIGGRKTAVIANPDQKLNKKIKTVKSAYYFSYTACITEDAKFG